MSEIGAVETVFLLLLSFVVIFGIFARKIGSPYPIVMVIGGLLISFVPAVPNFSLNPDLIFLIVLPPLLYSSAWNTSWRDFRYNIVAISLLAFGLVGFTVIGVALAAPHVFAGFDWRLGLVLGAVVAPTDAIAATSIARSIGLPSHIVDILEGESLINDATGLLALEFATEILVHEQVPTILNGVLTLFGSLPAVSPSAFSSVGSSIASNATLKMPPSKSPSASSFPTRSIWPRRQRTPPASLPSFRAVCF